MEYCVCRDGHGGELGCCVGRCRRDADRRSCLRRLARRCARGPPPHPAGGSAPALRHRVRRQLGGDRPFDGQSLPKVPDGFSVSLFAEGLDGARTIRVAPNGDVFVAQSGGGSVVVLRPAADDARSRKGRSLPTASTTPMGSPSIRRGPTRALSMSAKSGVSSATPTETAMSWRKPSPRSSLPTSQSAAAM